MSSYSFEVIATYPTILKEYNLLMDSGRNVFALAVGDLKEFLALLESHSIFLVKAYDLNPAPTADDITAIQLGAGTIVDEIRQLGPS